MRMPPGLHPHPVFAVRRGGLPLSTLDDLACPATARRLAELAELEERLRAEGSAISDALYPVIGELADTAAKPGLVALRRAVFQGRFPDKLLGKLTDVLPGELSGRIRRWAGGFAERDHLASELPGLLEGDLAAALPAVRRLAAHPELQRGLATSSPDLLDELRRWLTGDTGQLPSRRTLASLVSYASRMACKTSPRSTFTISGLGRLGADAADLTLHDGPTRTVTEVHAGLLDRVVAGLTRHPRLAGELRVRINPSLRVEGPVLRFLVPPPNNTVVTLRATPAVRQCLAAVGDRPGTLADLRRVLGGRSDDLVAIAGRLIGVGLLQAYVPVADQAAARAAALTAWLDSVACATAGGLEPDVLDSIARVRAVTELADAYATERNPHLRARQLASLTGELGALAADAGFVPAGEQPSLRMAFFENVTFTGNVATCPPRLLAPAVADLEALRGLFALYDRNLPLRLAMAEFVRQRWGAGAQVPFLALWQTMSGIPGGGAEQAERDPDVELRALIDSPARGRGLKNSGFGSLRRLHVLRQQTKAALAELTTEIDGVETIAPERVCELSRLLPDFVSPARSIAVYAQWAGPGEPRLVINNVVGGHGTGRGRVRRLAGLEAGCGQSAGTSGGEIWAEFDNLFGSPLNSRATELPFGIDYPGGVPHRRTGNRIPLGELVVVDTPDQVELRWDGHDGRVRPVHTGMVHTSLLPPAVQLLVDVFGESSNLLWPYHPIVRPAGPPLADGEVRAVPRLQVGRLVLRRASWITGRNSLPRWNAGGGDAAWLSAIFGWLREHGIPQRCFVSVRKPEDREELIASKSRKPHYFDATSWFHLLALKRALEGDAELIQFHEALPSPESALSAEDGSGYVTEFLFELNEKGSP